MSARGGHTRKYGKIEAGVKAQPIGFGAFKFVKIQPRLTNTDGSPNQTANLLYGDQYEQPFELTPGQFSEWIPVDDLSELYVRVLPGTEADTCTVAWVGSDRANT